VFLPRVTFEADPFGFRSRNWRLILERPVNAKLVVIILEIRKFHFQICRRPKQKMVEAFSTNGSDQSFNKRMREGNERYCFDFRDAEDSQVRLPLMESIQGIMIRTQILRNRLPSSRSIEHATQCPAIDHTGVNAESDDAPRVLVHSDEYPVRPQSHRLTSEQINAMKTIYRVTNESEPGRSAAVR
jgi:hypothetical protein